MIYIDINDVIMYFAQSKSLLTSAMETPTEKLEHCEVCANEKAKYTCPKCEVRTCSIPCVNIHKKELNCDGIRDRTKFVRLDKFTDLDLLSDYRMLEQINRSIDKLQRDPARNYIKQRELPSHLYKLKAAAFRRGTILHLMPKNFTRHTENTTYLNFKTNEIFWRIEWIFPQAEMLKWYSERVCETEILADVLSQIWDPVNEQSNEISDFETLNEKLNLRDRLQYYRAANFPSIKVLLKAEKVPNCRTKFFELETDISLQENFQKRNIIEFPTLYVVLKDHCDMYEIIDTDDEQELRSKMKEEDGEEMEEKTTLHRKRQSGFPNNRKRGRVFVKKPFEKKDKVDNKPKCVTKKKVSNFFFNGDVSDSDDESSTGGKSNV